MENVGVSLAAWIEKKRNEATANGALPTAPEYRCELCHDTGQIIHRVPGSIEISVSECECAIKRRNALRIKRSGLADVMSRYTFEAYKTPDKQTAAIKAAALRYVAESRGEWFVIVGRPGSGKTHICTAIVGKLIEGGKNCKYMLWRDEVRELKALVNDNSAYRERMNLLKNVDVLYIDDFLKGRAVSDGDLNVAFELLNARYNARKRTIISGERTIGAIMDIDEAIGSRIYERSKNGYCFETSPENRRLT
jgi:DNA replication protein DnaC